MELQGTARGCGLPACPTHHHESPNTSCPLPILFPSRAVAPRGQVGQQSCAAPSAGGIPLHGSCPSASCPLPPPHGSWEALGGYTPPAMPDTMEATPEAGAPRRPSMVLLDWLFRRCFSSTFSDSSWSMSA